MTRGHGGVEMPFALERGYDIRTVQELPGHKDVKTTHVYTHAMCKGANAVLSPLDR
jgi:site-specific recombinase XerD